MDSDSKIYRSLRLLRGFKSTGDNKWQACCPAHDDRSPSLSITKESDRWLLYCQAGCETRKVVTALGCEQRDMFDDSNPLNRSESHRGPSQRSVSTAPVSYSEPPGCSNGQGDLNGETIYDYRDGQRRSVFQVVRIQKADDKKTFRQRQSGPEGGWDYSVKGCPIIPYRLPELLAADPKETVFIVEGEKDVDRLRSIGLIATCNSGGGGKWKHKHSVFLKNRHVVILPDNDKVGGDHVVKIRKTLDWIAGSIKVVRLPGLPEKGDVSDWLDLDNTKEDLLKLVEEAEAEEQTKPEPRLQFQPFPVHCFPKKLAEFIIAEAKAVNVDPSMVTMPLLAAIAAAIGNARSIVIKQGWIEPAILWCGIVAASGDGKTPAAKNALKRLRYHDGIAAEENKEIRKEYAADLLDYEEKKMVWKKDRSKYPLSEAPDKPERPAQRRHVLQDVTPEMLAMVLQDSLRGVLIIRDELSGLFGGFDKRSSSKGSERATYLSIWSNDPFTQDCKQAESAHVESPYTSFFGGIQPELFHKVLGDDDVSAGLPARFLWAMPPSRVKRWTDDVVSPELIQELFTMFDRLFLLTPETDTYGEFVKSEEVVLCAKAKEVFIAFYNRNAKQKVEASGGFRAALAKMDAQCGRLALALHLAQDAFGNEDREIVSLETMQAAIELTEWFSNEANRIYSRRRESEEATDLRELVEFIESNSGTITARELAHKKNKYRLAGSAEAALNLLVEMGLGVWEIVKMGSIGGKSSKVFRLQ